jgi:hypothetical protein
MREGSLKYPIPHLIPVTDHLHPTCLIHAQQLSPDAMMSRFPEAS